MSSKQPVIISAYIRNALEVIQKDNLTVAQYREKIKAEMVLKETKGAIDPQYGYAHAGFGKPSESPVPVYALDKKKSPIIVEFHSYNNATIIRDKKTKEFLEFFKSDSSNKECFNLAVPRKSFHQGKGQDTWKPTTRNDFQFLGW